MWRQLSRGASREAGGWINPSSREGRPPTPAVRTGIGQEHLEPDDEPVDAANVEFANSPGVDNLMATERTSPGSQPRKPTMAKEWGGHSAYLLNVKVLKDQGIGYNALIADGFLPRDPSVPQLSATGGQHPFPSHN